MKLIRNFLSIVLVFTAIFSMIVVQAKSNKVEESHDQNMMHKLEVKSSDKGGVLLFSNSPEYVSEDGILYSDVIKGDARLRFSHENSPNSDKRIAVVVENLSNKKNILSISRGVVSEPSANYLQVGKNVQTEYMQETIDYVQYLEKGEKELLIEDITNHAVRPNQLLYGIYDFHSTGEVRVTVLMCPMKENPLEFIIDAKTLSKDKNRLRGTFIKMNRTIDVKNIYDPDKDGIGYVMLADNVNDLYKKGFDMTDGSITENYGNYGIIYTINLNIKKGKKARICLTPLGGYYAGAMRVTYKGETKSILTPNDRIYFGDKTQGEYEIIKKARDEGISFLSNVAELSELGVYEGGKVSFEYSPPGASNLPVHIILMPVDVKDN